MHVYRRGVGKNSSEAVHKDSCHGDAKRRPKELNALPASSLAAKRNKKHHRMSPSFNSDSLNKRLANGEGCMISLIFMGLSTGIIGSIIYSVAQYLS